MPTEKLWWIKLGAILAWIWMNTRKLHWRPSTKNWNSIDNYIVVPINSRLLQLWQSQTIVVISTSHHMASEIIEIGQEMAMLSGLTQRIANSESTPRRITRSPRKMKMMVGSKTLISSTCRTRLIMGVVKIKTVTWLQVDTKIRPSMPTPTQCTRRRNLMRIVRETGLQAQAVLVAQLRRTKETTQIVTPSTALVKHRMC